MPSKEREIVRQPSARRGRLVAFEGLDGSGKSTQVDLLLKELRQRAVSHEYISFPRTDKPGYGEAIAMFLRGELGAVESVSPYLVAALFAGDRASAKTILDDWLNNGRLVLADRYFYSNLAFQSAKCREPKTKQHFRAWIRQIEFFDNQIPKPDATIFFDVPFDFVRARTRERRQQMRPYLNGVTDIHESDLTLQERVALEYRSFSAEDHSFHAISCAASNGEMKPPEEIHRDVVRMLRTHHIL